MSSAQRVVIVGGGAGGISMAASLLKRDAGLDITIIEPSGKHYYQAAFTLVGGGCFSPDSAIREAAKIMPRGVRWLKAAVSELQPARNSLLLDNGGQVNYDYLVICPGLQLNWAGIEGLEETLGRNGVSSNYLLPYARYTWQCLQNMKSGRALFTQPPMPIKCAGAPQKAMYLSAHHWEKNNQLKDIEIEFHTATPALFGVAAFVPALEKYIDRYNVDLNFQSTLLAVDGSAKTARFKQGDGEMVKEFDFIHVVPPQIAPDFIRTSELADDAGWLAVQPDTLRHVKYENIFGVGDVINAPNAKTAAAVRKQVPVVADNLMGMIAGKSLVASYNGYGACPLTVEKGKVVLAEFGYGGKLLPSFPMDCTKPSRFGWVFKRYMLPGIYWDFMLKGREVMAKPDPLAPLE
jgi:sulfide:quinone oxidoreductase